MPMSQTSLYILNVDEERKACQADEQFKAADVDSI